MGGVGGSNHTEHAPTNTLTHTWLKRRIYQLTRTNSRYKVNKHTLSIQTGQRRAYLESFVLCRIGGADT
jgi:hypothetical protein